jgi:hypothetical protein
MKFLKLVVFTFFIIFSIHAHARSAVPLINHDSISIIASEGKTLEASQVKQAIEIAARSRDWTTSNLDNGKLAAKIVVRNKHTVMVEISYDASHYSINYLDSINMKYEVKNGQALIHPFYNKWVDYLKDSINSELSRL